MGCSPTKADQKGDHHDKHDDVYLQPDLDIEAYHFHHYVRDLISNKDVRSRLDQLNSMLKGFKEKERDLREMVQNAVDEQFDAENLPGAHWYKANYDAVVV